MRKQITNWGNYPVIEANEEFFSYPEQLTEILAEDRKLLFRAAMVVVMGMQSLAENTNFHIEIR